MRLIVEESIKELFSNNSSKESFDMLISDVPVTEEASFGLFIEAVQKTDKSVAVDLFFLVGKEKKILKSMEISDGEKFEFTPDFRDVVVDYTFKLL